MPDLDRISPAGQQSAEAPPGSLLSHVLDGHREVLAEGLQGVITWESDPSGARFTFVSRNAENLLGFPRREWLELPDFWLQLVHPDDRDKALATRKEHLNMGQDCHQEYRIQRVDGSWAFVYEQVYHVRDARENVDHLHGAFILSGNSQSPDSRTEEQSQLTLEALRDSETRLSAILDTAVDGIVTIDEAGIIESFNPAASEIFGYSPDEVIGRNVKLLMPEPDSSQHDEYLRHYLETGERRIIGIGREVTAKRKNGEVFPIHLAISEAHAGGRRFFTGIVTDISERKDAQDEVLAARNLLADIVDNSSTAIFMKDRDGRYVLFNRKCELVTGMKREDVLGKTSHDLLPQEDADELWALDRQVIETGEVIETEEHRDQQGRPYWALIVRFPLRDSSGRVYAMCGIATDITERKQAEDAVRETQENYRRLVEDAVFGIFQTTPEGAIVNVNPALAHIFGYEGPDEMIAAVPDFSAVYADRGKRGEFLGTLEEAGAVHDFQTEGVRKDGSRVWISLTARAVTDEHGRIGAIEGTITDISAKKVADEQRYARERQQAAVAELGQLALAGAELTALMDEAVRLVSETLQVQFCKLLELLPDGEVFLMRAGVGWRKGVVGRVLDPANMRSQAGYALVTAEPVIVEDLREEKRFTPSPLLMEHGVVSGLSVIIEGKERPFGVIGAHTATPRHFSHDDVNFVQSVANVLSLAIERRQAEEERIRLFSQLQVQRQRLDNTIANVPGVVWEAWGNPDESGQRIDFVSDYAETMLGYTVEEWLKTPNFWLTIVHSEDRVRAAQEAAAIYAGGREGLSEFRWLRKDGSAIWVEARSTVISDSRGNPIGMRGVTMDITQRKQAEQEIAQALRAEQQAREDAETAQNRLTLLVEMSALLAASSPDEPLPFESVARLMVPYLADWSVIDILSDDGVLQRVATVHNDPLKLELAKMLQQRSPDLHVDSGLARLLQTGQAQFYPEITDELLREAAPDREYLDLARSLDLRSAIAVPIRARGRVFGAITLVSAESGRVYKQTDVALAEEMARRIGLAIDNSRLYQELREASEAKDEFLGLVSHELRTPITAIYGGARVLRSRAERLDDESKNRMITDIEQESERLFRMVENLLALARVELGKGTSIEPVLAQRLIDRLVSALKQRKPSRRLEASIDPDLPPVAAEPVYLEQVLRNLISNADKYASPDTLIEIRITEDAGEALFSVLDRGPGVTPEEADLIFERFYRSERTANRASGIGMGLTVCRRLVEAQSGRIWARPREGGGLEVSFALPLYKEESSS